MFSYFFSSIYPINHRPKTFLDLLRVHFLNKPSLIKGAFTENSTRHIKFQETLRFLEKPENVHLIHSLALKNLTLWQNTSSIPRSKIDVIGEDWGLVTLENTMLHGQIYAVLNMASSEFPGGGCFEGGNAQEENLWQRSTCLLSMFNSGIIFDKKDTSFHYTPEMKNLIEARAKMNAQELQKLPHAPDEGFKVYFDKQVRVCFREPEFYLPISAENTIGSRESVDIENSFRFSSTYRIFPFFEMRSAAPYEDSNTPLLKQELQKRIAAQLDTLIINEQRYAVLGAWGCGQYKHNPIDVASIYATEIEKRKQSFDHIVFAIRHQGLRSSQTFKIFDSILKQVNLSSMNRPQFKM